MLNIRKVKTVANKLRKASKAHAGQAKALSGVVKNAQSKSAKKKRSTSKK